MKKSKSNSSLLTRREFNRLILPTAAGLWLPSWASAWSMKRIRRPHRTFPIALDPVAALDSADINASQSSFTFSSLNFGDPLSSRRIFACFAWRDSAQISDPTGATIGGVSASLFARAGYETSSVCIYQALVPSGSSGDVTINYGETISYGCSVTLIRVVHATTSPSFATSTEVSKDNYPGSNSLAPANLTNVPANSIIIGILGLQNTSSNLSWSSYTELIERNGANGYQYSIAYQYVPTFQSSISQVVYGAGNTSMSVCQNYIY